MTVLLLILASISSATCFTFSDSDAAKNNVHADALEVQLRSRPDCERVVQTGLSRLVNNTSERPVVGENVKFIKAVARFLLSNDSADDSLENCIELLSDYLATDADDNVTAVSARMKMPDFMFNPYMMIPQLIMMGFAPILLANLKMLVMNALMINNMALSSAIFMTVRNIVFGPKLGGQTKYVNYGYQKPVGHYHKYHHY